MAIFPPMLTNDVFSSAFLHQWCGGGVRAGVGPAGAIPLLKMFNTFSQVIGAEVEVVE